MWWGHWIVKVSRDGSDLKELIDGQVLKERRVNRKMVEKRCIKNQQVYVSSYVVIIIVDEYVNFNHHLHFGIL